MDSRRWPVDGTWRRSTRCAHGDCVEIRRVAGGVAVRDSKAPASGTLRLTGAEWTAFLGALRAGEYDA